MTIGLIWLIWLIGLIGLIGTYCGARGGRLQDWEHGGDARRWSRHTRRATPANIKVGAILTRKFYLT